MGINVAAEENYSAAIRQLFPKGEYWEKQFAKPRSDINLFCLAKTKEIIYFRTRMRDLLAESDSGTSTETIDDWERVLIGHMNTQLTLFERRETLRAQRVSSVNRLFISDIAKSYGLKVIDIIFPYKSSFFGFSRFGFSMFSCPAFFSVLFLIVGVQDEKLKIAAKKRIINLLETSSLTLSFPECYEGRYFNGIKALDDFKEVINNRLLSGNIVFIQYKLEAEND